MGKVTKFITIIMLVSVSFLTGVGLTYSTAERKYIDSLSNILLHELSNDLTAKKIMNSSEPQYIALNSQLNKNILETILSVSVIDPNVQKLDSISLESLCEVGKYNKEGEFENIEMGEIKTDIIKYLKRIEPQILDEIGKRQQIFKGIDCSTTIIPTR